jgi:hypothetical protein
LVGPLRPIPLPERQISITLQIKVQLTLAQRRLPGKDGLRDADEKGTVCIVAVIRGRRTRPRKDLASQASIEKKRGEGMRLGSTTT